MMTMMMMRSNWQAWTCMPARGRAGHFAEPAGHSHDQNYRQDFHHDDNDDDAIIVIIIIRSSSLEPYSQNHRS